MIFGFVVVAMLDADQCRGIGEKCAYGVELRCKVG
jgi:hypothetical protein